MNESFNFANFANGKALAKIKASIYVWIHIVRTKCIASKIASFANISSHNKFPLYGSYNLVHGVSY